MAIGDFIRKLPDGFHCCDSEGSTIDQMTRHAMQAQEARAQPQAPRLDAIGRLQKV